MARVHSNTAVLTQFEDTKLPPNGSIMEGKSNIAEEISTHVCTYSSSTNPPQHAATHNQTTSYTVKVNAFGEQ